MGLEYKEAKWTFISVVWHCWCVSKSNLFDSLYRDASKEFSEDYNGITGSTDVPVWLNVKSTLR